jgi:membrane protease YdiL (CAAX protease family)
MEFKRDAVAGAVACLAALAPVFIVQGALLYLLMPESESSGNPIIKMMQSAPANMGLFLVSAAVVAIVAPISEEIVFRVLLQGWLERWEDSRLGWREQQVTPVADVVQASMNDDARMTSEQTNESADSSFVIRHSSFVAAPPRRGVFGLPYGTFPIGTSAVLFGLAHFGYGPEPVAISLLGLVLGYLYQRTHRVVPSIVAHGLFNAFSVFVLWRMKFHGG